MHASAMMVMMTRVLSTFCLLFFWTGAGAQTPDFMPQIGANVQPRGALQTWETYPSGILRQKGSANSTLQMGGSYKIKGTQTVPSIFGNQIWINVEPVAGTDVEPDAGTTPTNTGLGVDNAAGTGNAASVTQCSSTDCWVYWGEQTANKVPNFLEQRVTVPDVEDIPQAATETHATPARSQQ